VSHISAHVNGAVYVPAASFRGPVHTANSAFSAVRGSATLCSTVCSTLCSPPTSEPPPLVSSSARVVRVCACVSVRACVRVSVKVCVCSALCCARSTYLSLSKTHMLFVCLHMLTLTFTNTHTHTHTHTHTLGDLSR
jgi:hypothetical protein